VPATRHGLKVDELAHHDAGMSEQTNMYPGKCSVCGLSVAVGAGKLVAGMVIVGQISEAMSPGKRRLMCTACFDDCGGPKSNAVYQSNTDRCEWRPSEWMKQLESGVVPECLGKKLPGLRVCAVHAHRESLIAVLLELNEELVIVRGRLLLEKG
jgi:hypothetical protein